LIERQSAFSKKDQIQLNAKVENLKEVIVSNKKEKSKRKIVGTKTETESS
jgi:hypothetical protein